MILVKSVSSLHSQQMALAVCICLRVSKYRDYLQVSMRGHNDEQDLFWRIVMEFLDEMSEIRNEPDLPWTKHSVCIKNCPTHKITLPSSAKYFRQEQFNFSFPGVIPTPEATNTVKGTLFRWRGAGGGLWGSERAGWILVWSPAPTPFSTHKSALEWSS